MAGDDIRSEQITSAAVESVSGLCVAGDPTTGNIDPTNPDERDAEATGNGKSQASNTGNHGSHGR